MRINIAASHRFHLLDLARELSSQGHNVRFYSYVPTKRGIKFGLNRKSNHSLVLLMLPFLAIIKITKGAYWATKLSHQVLDFYLSWFMRPCDVYIALGTVYEKSFIAAKKKFGALTILEWGSKHIEEQARILSEQKGVPSQPEYFIQRSLNGYEFADYISIASDHVRRSFVEKGVASTKIMQNPYGVDLSMFRPTELTRSDPYDLIMVGGWSYVKGCDLITQLCESSQFKFLHVGPIVDLPFPTYDNMTHVDAVDQSELIKYYAKARVFILPSRAEGLAMVQAQALACGLPIVCSPHTGGKDLRAFLNYQQWIVEMPEVTVEGLKQSVERALSLANTQSGLRSYSEDAIHKLTWSAYGKRYNDDLMNKVHTLKSRYE